MYAQKLAASAKTHTDHLNVCVHAVSDSHPKNNFVLVRLFIFILIYWIIYFLFSFNECAFNNTRWMLLKLFLISLEVVAKDDL